MGQSHLISIVGAGPGDPDLLTVKAMERIKNADVVLYDALIGDEILKFTTPRAIRKYVGKLNNDGQDPLERQNAIHQQFSYWAEKNKKVVRLKTGDPMVFGRGAEEVRFCKENHLNFEVIPGITAGIAGSSLFSVPLTERGKNNMFLFYACRKVNGQFPELESLLNILNTGSPVVLYMGMIHLAELANTLAENGLPLSTSVRILSKISQVNQKSYAITLGKAGDFLQNHYPETPSIVIIGKNTMEI